MKSLYNIVSIVFISTIFLNYSFLVLGQNIKDTKHGNVSDRVSKYGIPKLEPDEMWISSIPLDLNVCLVPIPSKGEALIDITKLYKNEKSIKGKTPISVKTKPGHYLLSVTRIYPFLDEHKGYDPISPFGKKISPWTAIGVGKDEYPFFQDKDNLKKDGVIAKTKLISGLSFKEGRPSAFGVDRIYKIEKKDGIPSRVVALHYFKNDSLESLDKLYPNGNNFKFNETKVSAVLSDKGESQRRIKKILPLLRRGGKIAIEGFDEFTIVVEILGENKWDLYEIKNDRIAIGGKVRTSKTIASMDILPPFDIQLKGSNEVRIKNPNDFKVTVGLRTGSRGKDFEVSANGVSSIYVPNAKYEIYFVYSNRPEALFQGDSFALNDNGVEIQIVKVVDGNYGIRRVK